MTLHEYLSEIEILTFELLINDELISDEVDHIADRVESTFYYVVEKLKEKRGNNDYKTKENEKV